MLGDVLIFNLKDLDCFFLKENENEIFVFGLFRGYIWLFLVEI